jgi:hypothetical protein
MFKLAPGAVPSQSIIPTELFSSEDKNKKRRAEEARPNRAFSRPGGDVVRQAQENHAGKTRDAQVQVSSDSKYFIVVERKG